MTPAERAPSATDSLTMYIETTNDQLQSLYAEDLMGDHYDPPGVEFSENGVANVVEEVGVRLVERYDTITERDSQ